MELWLIDFVESGFIHPYYLDLDSIDCLTSQLKVSAQHLVGWHMNQIAGRRLGLHRGLVLWEVLFTEVEQVGRTRNREPSAANSVFWDFPCKHSFYSLALAASSTVSTRNGEFFGLCRRKILGIHGT